MAAPHDHSSFYTFRRGSQLLSVLLVWALLLEGVDAQNQSEEVRTLLNFKQQNTYQTDLTGINYWNTWKEGDDNACLWVGVTCTSTSTVSKLDFSGWGWTFNDHWLNLTQLSNLTDLRELDMSNNILTVMPHSLDSLIGLILLDLSNTNMESEISGSISACRNLRFLYLQDNHLYGEIPSLSALVDLEILVLAHNRLSGPFPKGLTEIERLVYLDLSYNSLNGTIPSLSNSSSLVTVALDSNDFTAFEQNWLLGSGGANSSVQRLTVSFNQLQGLIPSGVTNLLNLQVLNMASNLLSGSIPVGFSLLVWFTMDFSQNNLAGEIPYDILQQPTYSDVDNCAYYPSLNLSNNNLNGSIPMDGANYNCFGTLDFSHNNLSGPVPPAIFNRTVNFVENLYLHHNQLSGDIVDVMFNASGRWKVFETQLQNNRLTGDLSRIVYISPEKLRPNIFSKLDLSNNYLQWSVSDVIPDPIRATLESLLDALSSLSSLSVGGNDFSGTPLPKACFHNQSANSGANYLGILDLSNSGLSGEISSAAFSSLCAPRLTILNVSNNAITGSVPNSSVTLPSLDVMDVSFNRLSGPLPFIRQDSKLSDARLFEGNPGLCGYPLAPCSEQGPGLQWWVLLITIGGSLTIALLSCLAATWRWRIYHKRHQQDADLIRTLLERDSATLLPLRELRKATDNFDAKAQIGEGGFATVYKGRLSDGTTVAIKKSKREGSEKDKEQFLNEVRILCQVSHRNLVKLMGCSMEYRISVLVFEFVPNGTLQEHLQGKLEAAPLTWKQRLNIAVQAADALNYLHTAATFPIYHRDVKSANILLNYDLDAKVADFGISRLAPLQATHVSTAAVQGTIGYIDPEYYTSYQLTDRSDVYSFGVVLLELIAARPVVDFRRGGEETSLVNFAGPYIQSGNLEGFIDPALTETYKDSAGRGGESILNVGRLAMACVNMRSKTRPSMREVLQELQELWLNLVHGTSKGLESIQELDDDDHIEREYSTLLSDSLYSGSSSSITVDSSSASNIQLSEISHRSCK